MDVEVVFDSGTAELGVYGVVMVDVSNLHFVGAKFRLRLDCKVGP